MGRQAWWQTPLPAEQLTNPQKQKQNRASEKGSDTEWDLALNLSCTINSFRLSSWLPLLTTGALTPECVGPPHSAIMACDGKGSAAPSHERWVHTLHLYPTGGEKRLARRETQLPGGETGSAHISECQLKVPSYLHLPRTGIICACFHASLLTVFQESELGSS